MDGCAGEDARQTADESLLIIGMLSLDGEMHMYLLLETGEEER
jgi:hypothetical protein